MKLNDFKVALFLTPKYVRGVRKWTTALTIFVMLLTFLNIIVVNGLLVGIIVGSYEGFRDSFTGDIFIETYEGDAVIEKTQELVSYLEQHPYVEAFSPRIFANAVLSEQSDKLDVPGSNSKEERLSSLVIGVDVEREAEIFNLPDSIIEGSYLEKNDIGWVIIGANLLERYSPFFDNPLNESYPGDRLDIDIGGYEDTFRIKGVIKAKAEALDGAVIMNDSELRKILGRTEFNADTIPVKVIPGIDPSLVINELKNTEFIKYARFRTAADVIGRFLDEIRRTFEGIGAIVGFIGLIVASITIFIIVFIAAIERQRFIGILKGIGISSASIKLSYVFLAMFYALIGITIGALLLVFVFIPYFDANPIDFPFSDGILYVPFFETLVRTAIILVASVIAGFIPARMIVNKPAIQSIMNR